jgi:hypothetical protein
MAQISANKDVVLKELEVAAPKSRCQSALQFAQLL